MELNEYQRLASKTAVFPRDPEHVGIYYCALKLCGEAGEHAEKVAKFLRGDHDGRSDIEVQAERLKIAMELGDVLWYVAALAELYGYTLSEIAERNIEKLRARADRGTIKGSGDDR